MIVTTTKKLLLKESYLSGISLRLNESIQCASILLYSKKYDVLTSLFIEIMASHNTSEIKNNKYPLL